MSSVYKYFVLLLLLLNFCAFLNADEPYKAGQNISHIKLVKNSQEYRKILAESEAQENQLTVFAVYRTEKPDKNRDFADKLLVDLEKAKELLITNTNVEEDELVLYEINCDEHYIIETCTEKDGEHRFSSLFGINQTRTMETLIQKPTTDEFILASEIIRMITGEWENYRRVINGAQLEKELRKLDDPTDFYICYGDQSHDLGNLFCFIVGRVLKEQGINVPIFTAFKRSQVTEISVYTSLGINTDNLFPMFGLWFVDCTHKKDVSELKECIPYTYKADHNAENIRNFVACLKAPSVVELTSDSTVSQLLASLDCHRLFVVYRSGNIETRKSSVWAKANSLAKKFHGTLYAIIVDLDAHPTYEEMLEEAKGEVKKTVSETIARGEPIFALRIKANKKVDKEILMQFFTESAAVKTIEETLTLKLYKLYRLYDETTEDSQEDPDPLVQDDEVEILLYTLKNQSCFHCPIKQKMTHKLNEKLMPKLVQEHKFFAVLFWLNVDTVSRAALHITIEASELLANKLENSNLGNLACHEWPDICKNYGVNTWPRLLMLSEGKLYKEYKGVWDQNAVANWISIISKNPPLIKLTNVEAVEAFTRGEGLSLLENKPAPAVTLVVVEKLPDDSDIVEIPSGAAHKLHGRYFLGVVAGDTGKKWLAKHFPKEAVPFLATFKPADEFEPVKISPSSDFSVQLLTEFIVRSSRPTVMKITETSFPSIHRLGKPFLILIAENAPALPVFKILGNVAKDKDLSELVAVTYVEMEPSKSLTKNLLKVFGAKAEEQPILGISDPTHGNAYLFKTGTDEGVTFENVKSWVLKAYFGDQAIEKSKLISRNWKKRPLLYDYKGFIYGEDSLRDADWLKINQSLEQKRLHGEMSDDQKLSAPENQGLHEKPTIVEAKQPMESKRHDEF